MYKLVVWMGGVSLHTIRVLDSFGADNDVIIAYTDRTFRGLTSYEPSHLTLREIRGMEDAEELMAATSGYIHVNNAFKVDPGLELLKEVLARLVKRRYTLISLFQEQYPFYGFKGLLRRVKWGLIYNWGSGRGHRAIGCCGSLAIEALRKAMVSDKRLFNFIYTPYFDGPISFERHDKPRFIIVGQLVRRKAVMQTVEILKSTDADFTLKIIGDGEEKEEIKNRISGDRRFEFKGVVKPDKLQREYLESDYLLLPSLFDGWGCTASEALTQGCKVLCSDRCGASSLIKENESLGEVFPAGDADRYRQALLRAINAGPLPIDERERIVAWSERISPKTEAEYLKQCLDHYFGKAGELPDVPWKTV